MMEAVKNKVIQKCPRCNSEMENIIAYESPKKEGEFICGICFHQEVEESNAN